MNTPQKPGATCDYAENRDSKLLLPMDESDQAAAVTAVMWGFGPSYQ